MIVAPAPGEVSKEGDMVSLKCSAYGLPAPQFTWQPSGKEVGNAGRAHNVLLPDPLPVPARKFMGSSRLFTELIVVYMKGVYKLNQIETGAGMVP